MAIPPLPPELIHLIITFIPDSPEPLVDLYHFGLACRQFHSIANRELYRRVVWWDQVAYGPASRNDETAECPWEWDQRSIHHLTRHAIARCSNFPAASTQSLALDPSQRRRSREPIVPAPVILVAGATNDVGLLGRLLRFGFGFDLDLTHPQATQNPRSLLQYLTATYYQPAPYHRDLWPWKHCASETDSRNGQYRPETDLELQSVGCQSLLSPLHLAAQYGHEEFVSTLLRTIEHLEHLAPAAARHPPPAASSSLPPWWLEVRARSPNLGASRHLAFVSGDREDDEEDEDEEQEQESEGGEGGKEMVGHGLTDPSEWPAATALHIALAHGHTGVATQLIRAGANWDRAVPGAWGVSGLALIAANGYVDLVEWLVARETGGFRTRGRDHGEEGEEGEEDGEAQWLHRDLPDQEGLYVLHYACAAPLPDLDRLQRLVHGLLRLGAVVGERFPMLRRRARALEKLEGTRGYYYSVRDGMPNLFPFDAGPICLVGYEPVADRVASRLRRQGVLSHAVETRPDILRCLGSYRGTIRLLA